MITKNGIKKYDVILSLRNAVWKCLKSYMIVPNLQYGLTVKYRIAVLLRGTNVWHNSCNAWKSLATWESAHGWQWVWKGPWFNTETERCIKWKKHYVYFKYSLKTNNDNSNYKQNLNFHECPTSLLILLYVLLVIQDCSHGAITIAEDRMENKQYQVPCRTHQMLTLQNTHWHRRFQKQLQKWLKLKGHVASWQNKK